MDLVDSMRVILVIPVVWGGYGADHFCVILIELCRYRVLYSFWDSGGAEGRALVYALSGAHFVV